MELAYGLSNGGVGSETVVSNCRIVIVAVRSSGTVHVAAL